jgi:hypothetical protein
MDNEMTLAEAIIQGEQAWLNSGKDVSIRIGKCVLTFYEGQLEMIEDDNGKMVSIPGGSVIVKK